MKACRLLSGLLLVAGLLAAAPACAEFVIGTAILEFTTDSPRQQDVELSGHGTEGSDYIVTEISEIRHPGAADEMRELLPEPEQGRLLVTPDKTILPAGSRQLLRFVLLQDLDATEHVYRVAIKPVVKGVSGKDKLGLKILIGYEVLVILRPAAIASAYTARRDGKSLIIDNTGNSDILFQNGQQCAAGTPAEQCPHVPVARLYPGQQQTITLPQNAPVTYSVWDGKDTVERRFE